MLVPKMFLGTGPLVARNAKKVVRRACDGSLDVTAFGEFVDPMDHPNSLFLTDQVSRTDPGEHFHCYAFFDPVFSSAESGRMADVFMWCIEESWRFLFVLGGATRMFFHQGRESCRLPFLRAALGFAAELDALGPRFKYLRDVTQFSSCNTAVTTLLQTSKVPVDLAVPGDTIRATRQYLAEHG